MNNTKEFFSALKTKFKGQVIVPGDSAYDAARVVFVGGIDKKPAVIIRPIDTSEVSRVVLLAQETGLPLAVRSGGHSSVGHCVVDGGIVLDLRGMKALEINEKNHTAWAQTGLTTSAVTNELDKHNLVLGFGDTGSVGIGGITTGGGIGFLVRKYGMTIDNVLAAEVVTADGNIHVVDATHEPDLFWAIRGGGGNFGVVTRFHYQLHELPQAYGGMMVLPATASVIAGCMREAINAPNELSAIFNVMPAPPMPFLTSEHHGKLIVMALMMYAGDPKNGEHVVQPFRKLATPLADMVHPMRYREIFFPEDESYHPLAISKTMFMNDVDEQMAQMMLDQLIASDASMRVVQMRALGGVMGQVASDATAFAHRKSSILTNVATFYTGPIDYEKRKTWVDETVQKIHQGDIGAYVGFLGDEGQKRVQAAYPGTTWDKLQKIKTQYDPTNLFRLNQNIPPKKKQQ
jgi:FAD/FMN-containing dehydrogenase